MNEVGLPEETAEVRALEGIDRSSDGTIATTRAQSCEADLARDLPYGGAALSSSEYMQKLAAAKTAWNEDGIHVAGLAGGKPFLDAPARQALLYQSSIAPAILRNWTITPLDDRILVVYASFREGYVCETCDGKGHSELTCLGCGGAKKKTKRLGGDPIECPDCRVVGSEALRPFSSGFIPCGSCLGTGLAPGVTAMPDVSKQDHSYGDIISCGAGVYDLREGDRVLFSKMAGIYVKGLDKNCCLLRRGEVMGFMRKV